MEYALRPTRPTDLPSDPRALCPAAWGELLPAGPAAALYFGAEFCEDRLPDVAEAEAYCALARGAVLEATLLTPVVTSRGLAGVNTLLASLRRRGWRPAVVFNDWGVLGLLEEQYATLPRRAGRLLNRSLRDPRAFPEASVPSHDPIRARRLRRLLSGHGAVALETDADLDGGYLGDGDEGLQRALHLPFSFSTTGRNCPAKASLFPEDQGFTKFLDAPCSAPCRCGPVMTPRDDTPEPLWRAGNTLFCEIPWVMAESWLTRADRVVLHPEPSP